jgi:DNA-binding transcriptional LysR family regulator
LLNLKHLYYYHIFAQELSTTRAAKRLSISAPALSNQLKELESFIGFKLTERVHGKLIITDIGKMVAHYADRMFTAYDELKEKLLMAPDFEHRVLRIGLCFNLGVGFSFDLLALSVNAHLLKTKNISVTYESSETLLAGFDKDEFDFIVGAFSRHASGENESIVQALEFPVRLFAPRRFMTEMMDFKSKPNTFSKDDINSIIEHANIKKIAVVLPSRPEALRVESDRFFSSLTTVPDRTIECNNSSAIVQLIERGLAMGFVPTPCLLDFKSAASLQILGPPDGYWTHQISIVTGKGKEGALAKAPPLAEILSFAH